jgi:hypothetical protein
MEPDEIFVSVHPVYPPIRPIVRASPLGKLLLTFRVVRFSSSGPPNCRRISTLLRTTASSGKCIKG